MTISREHEQMQELISRSLDNDLSRVERGILEEHLRTCLPCRRLAADMALAVSQLHGLAPKAVAAVRRTEIANQLERGGYMDPHPPLGYRLAKAAPKRLAWAISSILVVAGGGLALYSTLAPERSAERRYWAVQAAAQVVVRTVSQKSKTQGTLEDGGEIWTGDQIFLKISVQPSASGAALPPDEQAVYLSAMLVAGDGSSRLLTEQQRILRSNEIGPFVIAGGSGEGRLILVVTRKAEKVRFAREGCSDALQGAWCRTLKFEQKSLPPPRPSHQEMR